MLRYRLHYFTLLELLVTMGIIAVLAGFTAGGLGRARASARRTSCAGNLKQIGLALSMYSQNNNSRFPVAVSLPSFYTKQGLKPVSLCEALTLEIGSNKQVFVCPSDSDTPSWYSREGSSYEFNGKLSGEHIDRFIEIRQFGASKVVTVFDYDCFHAVLPQPKAKNYLFADGHVDDAD